MDQLADKVLLDQRPDLEEKVLSVAIDLGDSAEDQKWWTATVDSKKSYHRRLEDLLCFVRYKNEHNVICVGHSLWFKAFIKRHLDKQQEVIGDDDDELFDDKDDSVGSAQSDEKGDSDDLMLKLSKKKVENAGCVRVDIEFSDEFQHGIKIADVRLLFGTELV